MEQIPSELEKAECHFTWNLSELALPDLSMRSLAILSEENDQTMELDGMAGWTRRLNALYEIPNDKKVESAYIVDGVLQFVLTSDDDLISKYRTSCLHVVSAFKAFFGMKILNKSSGDIEGCLKYIKPYDSMSPEEKSAILAIKAGVLRFYQVEGTRRSVSLLDEAIGLSDEVEWKVSRLISLSRLRRHVRKLLEWEDIQDMVESLEKLLQDDNASTGQKITVKYYLALTYYDFVIGKKNSPMKQECVRKMSEICEEIHDKTTNVHVRLFCAERMLQFSGYNDRVGDMTLGIAKSILDEKPTLVAAHIVASKVYIGKKDFQSAAGHAQVAVDNGAFGASWLLLQSKATLDPNFDDEQFFETLLSTRPDYEGLIHLNASLFYFILKRDVLKGAEHIVKATGLENVDKGKPIFDFLIKKAVNPWEIAYNQIVISLGSSPGSFAKARILRNAKKSIEETLDCRRFNTRINLVEILLNSKNENDLKRPTTSSTSTNWRSRE
ncbi:Hypothetical protein NTJ_10803 [Nesidiocoris tenuis]|uniref:Uncharacterized protein n=1 Tax=Nesidiocoris tenuis TaxID=355587 RepID=A0ABN7B168_9HEMI|nr:Hypothetical protein NTJ_10803 [Nesidiocoris tenuis]